MTLKLSLQAVVLLLLVSAGCVVGSQEDIDCLTTIKNSVGDPLGYLNSWTLTDPDLDHCRIFGIECLHGEVYSVVLANSSLEGSFPQGFGMCKSLTKIDLSNNMFSGPISTSLCTDVPYLVTLDLANNLFTGPIPENLATCFFMNDLFMQRNDFCGPVPTDINNKTLPRLKKFDYSNTHVNVTCASLEKGSSNAVRSSIGMIVGVVIGALAVALLIGVGFLIYWWFFAWPLGSTRSARWNENDWIKQIKSPNSIVVSMFEVEKPLAKLKLSDLITATNNFSPDNIISTGKSGAMYRGTLKDGEIISIKRLESTDHSNKEFRSEMETLGRLKHRNLVPLLGYCIAKKERLLVYKYMPGGSLEGLLAGNLKEKEIPAEEVKEKDIPVEKVKVASTPTGNAVADVDVESGLQAATTVADVVVLEWETRLRVAIGTARGLAWLHHSCNPRVLHRNISPKNILIDDGLEPRISNFGLARLMNPVDTHISTFINGDFGDVGYVAPEYSRTLVATVKGDVYSFGVVLLQLVTGEKPTVVSDKKFKGSLAAWVWMLYTSGKVGDSVDFSLFDGVRDEEVLQLLMLAVNCVHPAPKERPTMYEVFHMLRAMGSKYQLTDENDEILVAASTADLEKVEVIVSTSKLAD